jgi:DNA primase
MPNSSVIEQIRQRVDIVDLVESFVPLKKAGKYFKANCPFHEEKTPSFVVSPDRQRWHCFGACHEGGDIFSFVMKWENVSFLEAAKILAERAGIPPESVTGTIAISDTQAQLKSAVLDINSLAARYYHFILTKSAFAEHARNYIHSRGVSDATCEAFMLGYAPESWSNLYDYLKKKGYKDRELMASGLFVEGPRGMYDRFRARIMFPIANANGQTIGFSGRLLKEAADKSGAKYINTPETVVYHKRESLYGIHKSRDAIRRENTAIVVEGEFDMITPYALGISNIVAIKGSVFTTEQLLTLKRLCKRLVLALDADAAGIDAMKKTAETAEGFDFELYVCRVPGGKDPDTAARSDFSALKKALKDAIPLYDFIVEQAARELRLDDPFSKKRFAEAVVPYFARIKNPIIQQHYIRQIAQILQTSVESVLSLRQEIERKKRLQRQTIEDNTATAKRTQESRLLLLQKYVLACIVGEEEGFSLRDKAASVLEPDDFTKTTYRELFVDLCAYQQGITIRDYAQHVASRLSEVFHEVFLYVAILDASGVESFEKAMMEMKKLSLTARLQEALKAPDNEHTRELIAVLDAKRREVEKRLERM